MNDEHLYMEPIAVYYQPLLCRYARMITRNEAIGWSLVQKVLAAQACIERQEPGCCMRQQLKTELRDLCLSWLLQQDAADFKGRAFTEDDIEKPAPPKFTP